MKEAFNKVSVEDKGLLDSYGSSHYSYHKGGSPVAICFPSSTTEVSLLMRACAENRLNVIVRGGGTSLEGQVLPLGSPSMAHPSGVYQRSTVVFDMSNMQKILEVNRQDLDCRVQAGVGWAGLGDALKRYGLAFPVDPGPGAV
jgi:D-lactate dehydrogenase (cytochrome)